MKKILLTLGLLSFSFTSMAALLSQEEIDEFNANSNDLKIVNTFDPSKITTLVVGAGILGSEGHFFGSRSFLGGGTVEYVSSQGELYSENPNKKLHEYIIPDLRYDSLNNKVSYKFNDVNNNIIKFSNKKDALSYQNRNIISPIEVDPENTLYLDIDTDCIVHLKGSVFDLIELPFSIKVDKIVIEYLGDRLYKNKDFNKINWNWLHQLHGIMNDGCKIYYEMRNECLEYLHDIKPFSSRLMKYIPMFKAIIRSPEDATSKRFQFIRDQDFRFSQLKDEDFECLTDYVYPMRGAKQNDIVQKFIDNGFDYLSYNFFEKYSVSHIPNRFYNTIRIEVVISQKENIL
ncbi:MAG: hypothetical protein Q8L85_00480 [Alphaproteobacteria bacterium]|nr:hypothetical protein [Alphaproteobacteria bacterium]